MSDLIDRLFRAEEIGLTFSVFYGNKRDGFNREWCAQITFEEGANGANWKGNPELRETASALGFDPLERSTIEAFLRAPYD
jgi:hypothetical protein